ncbi:MAG TPA: FGGY family carbohydrate kinase [Candidatus Manganitrophaceae bacterium]|nr:FGGY family carbohydrate kinase [Candidatus Manganitrophaceae bacterium]
MPPRASETILALDQGSSRSRAVLFDAAGRILSRAEAPVRTYYPNPGWVEHDPEEIFESAASAARRALRGSRRREKPPAALGIANQRSTFILWDGQSGKPLAPAISWQDLRAAGTIQKWDRPDFVRKTGLPLTPYYAAAKLALLLTDLKRKRISARRLLFGTVNTFLIWRLTEGKVHRTDPTNAARTLLYNIDRGDWDDDLLRHFKIPRRILPEVAPTQSFFGEARIDGRRLPITCAVGDQQASLAGLGGLSRGIANVNYGTGGFFLINTGPRRLRLPGLLSSVAWSSERQTTYLVEGTVNSVGSLFDWLRRLGLLDSDRQIDPLCARSTERIFFIPALAGLGAPHWDPKIATTLFGLSRSTGKEELVRGAVEGIAFLMNDIYRIIKEKRDIPVARIIASGGASQIDALVQFQSNLFGKAIFVTNDPESTVRGAAFLAGEQAGVTDRNRFRFSTIRRKFSPRITEEERKGLCRRWRKSLALAQAWGERGNGALSSPHPSKV